MTHGGMIGRESMMPGALVAACVIGDGAHLS
jgi:hypothetical protein